jgi:hypothetical protein
MAEGVLWLEAQNTQSLELEQRVCAVGPLLYPAMLIYRAHTLSY